MKKRLLLPLALLVLLITACSPHAVKPPVLHMNPAMVGSEGFPPLLLFSYGEIFERLGHGDYADSASMLSDLKQIELPEELKLLFDRYNHLILELTSGLDNIEILLDDAANLIEKNNLGEAAGRLEQTAFYLTAVIPLHSEINQVTGMIGTSPDITAPGAASEIKASYQNMVQSSKLLDKVIDRLEALRHLLNERQNDAMRSLLPTSLSLILSSSSVFADVPVTISGCLTSGGNPLAARHVVLRFGDTSLSLTTDIEGGYLADITLPQFYENSLAFKAEYAPSGSDKDVYQACTSTPVFLDINHYRVNLCAEFPPQVHPGKTFSIKGTINHEGPSTAHTLSLSMAGHELITFTAGGDFHITTMPPTELAPGNYQMILELAPAGRYSGSSQSVPCELALLPLTVSIDTRGFVVLPSDLKVQAAVSSADGALNGAMINLSFTGGKIYEAATDSGILATTIPLSLSPGFFGQRYLSIAVQPQDPWLAPFEQQIGIFIFNPLAAGLAIAPCLVLFLAMIYSRNKSSHSPRRTRRHSREPVLLRVPPTPSRRYALTGIKGIVIDAYLEARTCIEKLSGNFIGPANTMREFLDRLSGLLPRLKHAFAELTGLAEHALYSKNDMGPDSHTKAMTQAKHITDGKER